MRLHPSEGAKAFVTWRHKRQLCNRDREPLAPHLGEELWEAAGGTASVFRSGWLEWDAEAARGDVVTVVAQVDGKLRAQLELPRAAAAATAEAAARSEEKIQRSLEGREVQRVVNVPDRLVNFVLKRHPG
jgi:leucyl-tRNA synthetase